NPSFRPCQVHRMGPFPCAGLDCRTSKTIKRGIPTMNNEPKNLTELVAAFCEKMSTATALDKKADTARIEAGKLMLECRSRVVAGEAGDHYKTHFWLWFDANVKGRSRNDAAKVMALASAPDPMAALEEERRKAREGMAATRQRRSSNVRE